MYDIIDRDFIRAALVRALRTICQTAIATIGTAAVMSDVDWKVVVSASLLAGLLSILTSITTSLPEVQLQHSAYMDVDEPTDSCIIEEEGEDDE